MKYRDIASITLELDEGFRGKPYRCTANKETIGYGHNLDAKPLTKGQARKILDDDITSVIYECHKFSWFVGLCEVRKCVIVNMIFNLGLSRFKKFKKTISAIDDKDYGLASIEMLDSRWAAQVGRRAERLSEMMKTGEMHEDYRRYKEIEDDKSSMDEEACWGCGRSIS